MDCHVELQFSNALYFGGVTETSRTLERHDEHLNLRALPLTILCFCLPEIKPTKRALVLLKLAVQQALLSILCTFAQPALFIDGSICEMGFPKEKTLKAFQYTILAVDILSTVIAITALSIIQNSTQHHLKHRTMS